MRTAFVALLVAALGAPARADGNDSAVGVVVQGSDPLRGKVEGHLGTRVRGDGYTLNDQPLSKDALDTIANCFILEDLTCATGVFEARSRTPRLIFARIDEATGEVTIDVTWFAKGREPVSTKATCNDCPATWKDHTNDLYAKLSAQAEMPIITEPDPEEPRRRSTFWSRTLVVAGAATVVTGGVLLYYGLRDGVEHKYVYPRLTPVGISLIALGGGAMIGGMITW